MRRIYIISLMLTSIFGVASGFSESSPCIPQQDTLKENQILYNGKIWRNLYNQVQDNQFLFSGEYLNGAVTISGKTFTNVRLRYDIYKDELLTPVDPGNVLQLNKELIDSFALSFQNNNYMFIKIEEDSVKNTSSFFNVLYKGRTDLLIRYSKKIDKLAVEGKYDKFYQLGKIYMLKNKKLFPLTNKNDLLNALQEDKDQIKEFMRKSRIKVSEKEPESFIPVIRYFDNLNN